MLEKKAENIHAEAATMVVDAKVYKARQQEKPQVWCDHCDKPCHTQETDGKVLARASWNTLFTKHVVDGRKTIIIVYVDDIIITKDKTQEIEQLKR